MFHAYDQQPSPPVNPIQNLHLYQPLYGHCDYSKSGDTVLLVHGDLWCKVILHSHTGASDALNGSLYWNYYLEDRSHFTGGYIFPGQSWGVLRGGDRYLDISHRSSPASEQRKRQLMIKSTSKLCLRKPY